MWYSSDRAMISSWIACEGPCCQQVVQVHPGPEPRDERVALLGVLERDASPLNRTGLLALRAGDDRPRPVWSLPVGQVAAQEDLLRAGRQVRQLARDRPGPCAGPGTRPSGPGRPAGRSRPSSSRATACGPCSPLICRTEPPPSEAIAFSTTGSKLLPTATAWHGGRLPSYSRLSRLAKADRIGVAGRDDAVADVDDAGLRPAPLQGRRRTPCPDRSSPARRGRPASRARACDVLLVGRHGLVEGPVAIDVADGQVERVRRASARRAARR